MRPAVEEAPHFGYTTARCCWLDFAAGVPCQALEREREEGLWEDVDEHAQLANRAHTAKQYISLYIHATMNSVCTRCSLRLQRAAHTELRSTSTRAFSSAPVQRRGKCYEDNGKTYSILTLPRHPDLPRNLLRRTQYHPRFSPHQTLRPRLPGLPATAPDLRHQKQETAPRQPSNCSNRR